MHFLTFIFGIIVIFMGLKSIVTQEVTITIQLWGDSSNAPPSGQSRGYSTSNQTGFVAVIIGILQIIIGIGLILKGPEFLKLLPNL